MNGAMIRTVAVGGLLAVSLWGCSSSNPTSKCKDKVCNDQIDCTTDSCNETTGECVFTPDNSKCAAGQVCDAGKGCLAKPCQTDADCADGVWCNGDEKCAGGTCSGGKARCDDGFSCTNDSCDEQLKVCHNLPDDTLCPANQTCDPGHGDPATGCRVRCSKDADCDDGKYCNGQEHCQNGTCTAGTPVPCDDSIACTVDSCSEASKACQNVPDHSKCQAGQLCDPSQGGCVVVGCTSDPDCQDASFCNGAETCQNGTCYPGTALACDDQVPCTVDSCNEQLKACEFAPDNSRCGPGQMCDPVQGCKVKPCQTDVDCDDHLYCNGAEVCNNGNCQAGTKVSCDDQVACTVDSCNEVAKACDHFPDNSLCASGELCDPVQGCKTKPCQIDTDCDDHLYCNGNEVCNNGNCQAGTKVNCDDNIACTVDVCDEAGKKCTHTADDSKCDDGKFCNGQETCDVALDCQPGTSPNCDDGIDCTVDVCDEAGKTCTHTADNSKCDDGIDCTVDICDTAAKKCTHTPDDSICDDTNPCTTDVCSLNTAKPGCVNTVVQDGTSCSDGNVCNGDEVCRGGMCQAGRPLPCDDQNPCTSDGCDPVQGCLHQPYADGTPCPDGDLCNGDEVCANGRCQAGKDLNCDDTNPCTTDQCFSLEGCVHWNNAIPCDDGDKCTVNDTCSNGTCAGVSIEICGNNQDDDCDGLTDEGCNGIGTYVAPPPFGNNFNPGTMARPLATITAGIGNAKILEATEGPQTVYVAGDNHYTYQEDLQMAPGISVLGGYSADGQWIHDPLANGTFLQGTTPAGIKFLDPAIDRDTVLDGFAISGIMQPGNTPVVSVTINGCRPTLSNNSIQAGQAISCTGVSIENGANPVLVSNTLSGGTGCAVASRAVEVDGSGGELRGNKIDGGSRSPLTIGVNLVAPLTAALFDNDISGGSAQGGAGTSAVQSMGVHLSGRVVDLRIEANRIAGGAATGQAPVAFGIALENCNNSAVLITGNPSILGGSAANPNTNQGSAVAVNANSSCPAQITKNGLILGGSGSSPNGIGIHCASASACVIEDNAAILGSQDFLRASAGGVVCESGSCASISRNPRIIGGNSSAVGGVGLSASSPVVDRNGIAAGSCPQSGPGTATTAVGLVFTGGSMAPVTNNIIFGGACSNSYGVVQVGVISTIEVPNVNVNGNYINGHGLGQGTQTSYGIFFAGSDAMAPPQGDFFNNIINAGYAPVRIGVYEAGKYSDPRSLDYNDIIGGVSAVYVDEGTTPLISIGQVNALTDIVTGHNLLVYPYLVDEEPGGDFHLTDLSTLIDSGTTQDASDHDMDGDKRPQGLGVDIGADELR